MSAPLTLYAATSNQGKLAEFIHAAQAAEFDGPPIQVLALPDLASIAEPNEYACTFMGNAELKAVAYSLHAPDLLVFADDSGLEVTALDGAPGVRSARFADDLAFQPGLGTKDERNNRALLSQLMFCTDRSARFVCTIALARNGEVLLRAEGHVAGEILTAPWGTDGFGYDPLFLLPSLNLTFAELPRPQKWALSHRGRAFRSLLIELRSLDF